MRKAKSRLQKMRNHLVEYFTVGYCKVELRDTVTNGNSRVEI